MPPSYVAVKPCHTCVAETIFPDTRIERNRTGKAQCLGAGRAVVEAAGALDDGLLRDGDDVGGDGVELGGDVSNIVLW